MSTSKTVSSHDLHKHLTKQDGKETPNSQPTKPAIGEKITKHLTPTPLKDGTHTAAALAAHHASAEKAAKTAAQTVPNGDLIPAAAEAPGKAVSSVPSASTVKPKP